MRAQASIEFIMTYAWAIIVALVIVGALTAFGIHNYDSLFPPRCTFSLDMPCHEEPLIQENSVSVVLTNSMGKDIYLNPDQQPKTAGDLSGGYLTGMVISVQHADGKTDQCAPGQLGAGKAPTCRVGPDETFTVKMKTNNTLTKGSRVTMTPAFTYTTNTQHTFIATGELIAKVE